MKSLNPYWKLLLISIFFVSGCSPTGEQEESSNPDELQKGIHQVRTGLSTLKEIQSENADLSKKVVDLSAKLKTLEATLVRVEDTQKKLNQKATELEFRMEQYQTANLDESEKGYQRLETESGFFLVKIRGNQPYLDGYKVFLEILNPNAVSYRGVTVSVKWGRAFDSRQNYDAWLGSLREKPTKLPTILGPGARSPLEVILPRTLAEELGFISVSMQIEGVTVTPKSAATSSASTAPKAAVPAPAPAAR